jgi:opacity protein-like surface antigen
MKLGIHDDVNDLSTTITLYDPIVGTRMELGLTKWLSAKARGDVGGFGINAWDTSDLEFNVEAGLEFHLARWFDMGVGYRWLNYDFVTDSGNSSFDATLSGPVVELRFNF